MADSMGPPNGEASVAQTQPEAHQRTTSFSQNSEASQTAQEFISNQLQLEADAREALPYQFDTCTRPLGPIRQNLFSCLTCNPPPADSSQSYTAAGLCYSCSISCHGEHQLVELFTRRNFVCDCGTTRLPKSSPCSLRTNIETGAKGGVYAEEPAPSNNYNHNFRNRFCGCNQEYDAHNEKGTMYQCLGMATEDEGGCDEDWWHPECILGLRRDWHLKTDANIAKDNRQPLPPASSKEEPEGEQKVKSDEGNTTEVAEDGLTTKELNDATPTPPGAEDDKTIMQAPNDLEHPTPPNFPAEDNFEHFVCYKCTNVHPWIKRYADTTGFLPAVPFQDSKTDFESSKVDEVKEAALGSSGEAAAATSRKRKADDDDEISEPTLKKSRSEDQAADPSTAPTHCIYSTLPPAPTQPMSLFVRTDFRDHLCRCPTHFPLLTPHPALLEEEYTHEPPLSASSPSHHSSDNQSLGTRSLLDRGEAALSNMDRVRAIEGVMAYNHLRDKVKDFLKPFAESGTPVGAEDVKKYFEKLRGDEAAIRLAAEGSGGGDRDGKEEGREQGGSSGQPGY